MNTLLIQNGAAADAMLTLSLVRRLLRDGDRIHCIAGKDAGAVLGVVPGVRVDFLPAVDLYEDYDRAINLHPDPIGGTLINMVNANDKRGYGFDGQHIVFLDRHADLHYRVSRLGVPSDNNLFQLVYGMAGVTWDGEGYGLTYHPRNRQKKSLTGLCVKDAALRGFITDNLRVKGQVRHLPIKQNTIKQVDEINRCKRLITDDEGCMHIGLALHKHVEYIARRLPPYPIHMFGSGNVHVFNIHSEDQ
jgi:hypothetical protein